MIRSCDESSATCEVTSQPSSGAVNVWIVKDGRFVMVQIPDIRVLQIVTKEKHSKHSKVLRRPRSLLIPLTDRHHQVEIRAVRKVRNVRHSARSVMAKRPE